MIIKLLFRETKLSFFALLMGFLVPTFGFSNNSIAENSAEAYQTSVPVNCNALIMPGVVTGIQYNCGAFDPAVISNLTLATSTEGPVKYIWMYRSLSTGYVWTTTGVTTDSIDPV